MAGDYSSGMEEVKRGKPTEKLRVGTTRSGDYASGMEEKNPKPKRVSQTKDFKDSLEGKGTFSSPVEGEAQAASREAAKRQAARKAASTVGKGFLRGAARFAGPAGLLYSGYELLSAATKSDKFRDSLFKAEDYKREKAELDALVAARKRGLATRKAREDAGSLGVAVTAKKKSAPAMDQISMGTSPTPKAAKPTPPLPVPQATRTVSTPPSAPKLRNYSTEAADRLKKLGFGEDNAVTKRLRERAVMSQKERDKPFGEDNEVLKKLRAAGYNFAKGGKINGAARKGKTKGRYI